MLRGMNHIFTGTPLRGPAGRKRKPVGGVSASRRCFVRISGNAGGLVTIGRGAHWPTRAEAADHGAGCLVLLLTGAGFTRPRTLGGGRTLIDVPVALQLTDGVGGMCHCASSAFVRLPKRRLYCSHGNRQVRHERNRVGLSAVAGRSGVAAIWICRRAVPPFSAAAGESSAGSRPRRGSSARPASAPRWRPP